MTWVASEGMADCQGLPPQKCRAGASRRTHRIAAPVPSLFSIPTPAGAAAVRAT